MQHEKESVVARTLAECAVSAPRFPLCPKAHSIESREAHAIPLARKLPLACASQLQQGATDNALRTCRESVVTYAYRPIGRREKERERERERERGRERGREREGERERGIEGDCECMYSIRHK